MCSDHHSTSDVRRPGRGLALLLGFFALFVAGPAYSQGIDWKQGIGTGHLGDVATVHIPYQYVFAGPEDTKTLMTMMQNPVTELEVGLLTPESENQDWFIVFEYEGTGYVKDDEKNDLDADALFDSINEATEYANKERSNRGWSTLTMVGWQQPPRYNESTHNLEWATKARDSDGEMVINYNTRLLGRSGVMSVTLVADPGDLQRVLPAYRKALGGFEYLDGQRYAQFQAGDKIAKYGLAALITGGAAAVAFKTGLLQKFWKLIVVAFAGLAGVLKKMFGRKTPATA
jgi:uncharacterized membrane-anchored protein